MKETNASVGRVVALAVALCGTACAYAIMRILQSWLYPDPDPRLVSHVMRIAFFWRAGLSLYVGCMIFLGALAVRRRRGAWLDAQLPRVVAFTFVLALIQGLLVP